MLPFEMKRFETKPLDARTAFTEAAGFLVDTASRIAPDQWHEPGLGDWTVRELVGHAGRALQTVTAYLGNPRTPGTSVDLAGPIAYFLAAFDSSGDSRATSQAILERGLEAGKALGADPLAALRAIREEAIGALHQAGDDVIVTTPMGTIAISDYLPTRTFELIIHTIDLARAVGTSPTPPVAPLTDAAVIAAALAVQRGYGVDVCLALTGRTPLGPDLSFL